MKKNNGVAFEFKPFSKKQKKLLSWWQNNSPFKDCDIIIADGAIRSGKTIAMIMSFITYTLHTFKNQNFIIAGKSVGAVKRNVLEPMFQILNALGIPYKYIRSENPHITIGSNIYYIFGASNEASQDTLQGLTGASALLDEVALFPRNFVDQTIGRCSVKGSKIFMNCNPSSPFHWLKTDFIDQSSDKNILHLHFNLDDNLSLSQQTKDKYKRMFSGVFYKRYIDGLWTLADGLVYDGFTDDMVVEVVPMIKRYWIGVDYGNQNSTSFILVGMGIDNKCYIIDEYRHSGRETSRQKSPSQYAEELKVFIAKQGVNIDNIFIDPAATSFIVTCHQAGIQKIATAFNDVKYGIGLIQSLMVEDNFRIHKRCKYLLKNLSDYSWCPKAQKLGEDKPMKQNDDQVDAMRYGIVSAQNVWMKTLQQQKGVGR
jgi:PBSX family phage terminase large subunit